MRTTVYFIMVRYKGKVYVEAVESKRDQARTWCRSWRHVPGAKSGDVWYVGRVVNVPTKRKRRKQAAA